MIYRRFELAQSLNGTKIVHIARNASGHVLFRESSEGGLKKMIDMYHERVEAETKAKAVVAEAKRRKKLKKKALFSPPPPPEEIKKVEEEIKQEVAEEFKPPKEISRGPGGKFISKSQLEMPSEEPKKRNFWEKLTSN